MSGPLTMTIMALISPPISVDTNASALRMSVAPIEANRTPIQYHIAGSPVLRFGRAVGYPARPASATRSTSTTEERHMRAAMASGLLLLPALLFAAGGSAIAQEAGHHDQADHDHAVEGGGTLPAGWSVRTDDKAATTNVKVVSMGTGIHVTLGPAIILYRAQHAGTGPFHTLATFTQTKPTKHAEGYGLFYGGKALDGAAEQYTYFLIRQDGTYLVKRREGDKTSEVTKGWVASAAVHKPDAKGTATNKLEIDNKSDPSKVVFLVNGEPVYTLDAKATDTNGTVGLRVNHNLDLHIEGFDVHR